MKDPDLIIIPSKNEPSARMLLIACQHMFKSEVVIAHDVNGNGKGWAIRQILRYHKKKEIVAIIDGDFDISPLYIDTLMDHIENYDVVVAEKDLSNLPLQRKIISMGYRLLIKILFSLNVNDTQTGLKLWKWHALSEFNTDGFAFDIEMLANAHNEGLKIKSVLIKVNIDKKVRFVQIWNTLKETLKVWLALSFQDTMKTWKSY